MMLYILCAIAGAIVGICLTGMLTVSTYTESVTEAYEKGRADERAKMLTEFEERFVG